MLFQTKLRQIEAEQYNGEDIPGVCRCVAHHEPPFTLDPHVHILGPIAFQKLEVGDWIVTTGGEFTPPMYRVWKPADFERYFEVPPSYPGEASLELIRVRLMNFSAEDCVKCLAAGSFEPLGTRVTKPLYNDFKLFWDAATIKALETHVRQLNCPHEHHLVICNVHRITQYEGGPVERFSADLLINCRDCEIPFHFVGFPYGVLLDKPAMSPNGCEARLPIAPGTNMPKEGNMRFEVG